MVENRLMLPQKPIQMHICFFTHLKSKDTLYISYICSMLLFWGTLHMILEMCAASRDQSRVVGRKE